MAPIVVFTIDQFVAMSLIHRQSLYYFLGYYAEIIGVGVALILILIAAVGAPFIIECPFVKAVGINVTDFGVSFAEFCLCNRCFAIS